MTKLTLSDCERDNEDEYWEAKREEWEDACEEQDWRDAGQCQFPRVRTCWWR